ncbi:PhoH family protein [Bradyrhizobium sp. SZCCHNR3118]|uniref:PhoH family protein n=1 Tax=Bradyrhizobium sp. SZCCHNR3118 TaxID=3057468 RepID=UPI002916CA8E|nr:PhoH family protein [Bradyrhizobium sp. SZCCHNR3118]
MSRRARELHENQRPSKKKIKSKFMEERDLPPLLPLSDRQDDYLKALRTSQQVIVMGPAGTGKTHIAGTYAADQLRLRRVEKIYVTRPNVPGGRSLGFFPGTMDEKIAPWVVPLMETIKDRIGAGALEVALKNGDIEIVPFEVMRGRTFKNCIVILDEAQNTLAAEIKMFLTRIGENCQVIINGDISQSDLKETSGLRSVLHMIKSQFLPVPIIEFTVDDIVRSGICEMWVKAFDAAKI